jgi:hypothetical protein
MRNRDRDDILTLSAEHLLLAEVLAQLLAHSTPHDFPETTYI